MKTLQEILAKTVNFQDNTKISEKSTKIMVDFINRDVIKVIVTKVSR